MLAVVISNTQATTKQRNLGLDKMLNYKRAYYSAVAYRLAHLKQIAKPHVLLKGRSHVDK